MSCRNTYINYGSYLKSRDTDKQVCDLKKYIDEQIANIDISESLLDGGIIDGNLEITGTLDISDNTTIYSNLIVLGDISGNITGNLNIIGDTDFSCNSITDVSSIQFCDGSYIGNINNTNNFDISASKILNIYSSQNIVHADTVFKNNIDINGNLRVNGTTTYVSTDDLTIKDNLIFINQPTDSSGNPVNDPLSDRNNFESGFIVYRGPDDFSVFREPYLFLYDNTTETFRIGISGDLQPVATREDNPLHNSFAYWDSSNNRLNTQDLITISGISGNIIDISALKLNIYNDVDISNGVLRILNPNNNAISRIQTLKGTIFAGSSSNNRFGDTSHNLIFTTGSNGLAIGTFSQNEDLILGVDNEAVIRIKPDTGAGIDGVEYYTYIDMCCNDISNVSSMNFCNGTSITSGNAIINSNLDMSCNLINDVSGIYFCDGTYIGHGNSFDISTSEVLKINHNAIVIDTNNNIGFGTDTPTDTITISGGSINMTGGRIINVADGSNNNDLVNVNQLNDVSNSKLNLTGGTMSGTIDMSNNNIENIGTFNTNDKVIIRMNENNNLTSDPNPILTLENTFNFGATQDNRGFSILWRGERENRYGYGGTADNLGDIGWMKINKETHDPENVNSNYGWKYSWATYTANEGSVVERANLSRDGLHITSGGLTIGGNDNIATFLTDTKLFVDGNIDLSCNLINDVSGIYFCDGTYIGHGNSFDISTNEVLKINQNAIVVDTNNNIGFGTDTPTDTITISGGSINMTGGRIINVADGSNNNDLVNVNQLNEVKDDIVDLSNVVSDNIDTIVDLSNVVSDNIDNIVDLSNVVSDNIDTIVDLSNVVSDNIDTIVDLSNVVSDNIDTIVDLSNVVSNKVDKSGDTMTGELILETNNINENLLTLQSNFNIQTDSDGAISSAIQWIGDRNPRYSNLTIGQLGRLNLKYEQVAPESTDGGKNSYAFSFNTYSQQDGGLSENMDICRDGVHIKTGNLTLGASTTDNDQQLNRKITIVDSNGTKIAIGHTDSTGNIFEQEFNYVGDNDPLNSFNFQFRGKGICQFLNNGNLKMSGGLIDMSSKRIISVADGINNNDAVNVGQLNQVTVDITDLSNVVSNNINDIDNLSNAVSTNTSDIIFLTSQVSDNTNDITDLSNVVSNNIFTIADLSGTVYNNRDDIANLANDKVNRSGDSMTGVLDMGNNKIINVADGTNLKDVVNVEQLNDVSNNKLNLTGGTMSGTIDMNNNNIENIGTFNTNDKVTIRMNENNNASSQPNPILTLENTFNFGAIEDNRGFSILWRGERENRYGYGGTADVLGDIGWMKINKETHDPENVNSNYGWKYSWATYTANEGSVVERANLSRDGLHITSGGLTIGGDDNIATFLTDTKLFVDGNIDLSCGLINDVSGIHFCDGTYIGHGNSFDISTSEVLVLRGTQDVDGNYNGASIVSKNRIYQELNNDTSWNTMNGYVSLAKDRYPSLNPYSSGNKSVSTWTTRTSAGSNFWNSVCWSPELGIFVAVGFNNNNLLNRIMTSSDGIQWISRTATANYIWNSVCWSPELGIFVAVSSNGLNDKVMTSPDGINWIPQITGQSGWNSVCWSPELSIFVAVGSNGTNNNVMTSSDGINWTLRTSASVNSWQSVCWSPELSIFVAVSIDGNSDRVMTSSDGIQWTSQISVQNAWRSVCWSSEMGIFVAVSSSVTNNHVMTSPDGINWASRTSAADNLWQSVCWSPELSIFVAVGITGSSNRVMTSPNGIQWTSQTTNNNEWTSVCWSPELGIFTCVGQSGTGNRVMTSSIKARPPSSYNVFDSSFNNIDENGNWTLQTKEIKYDDNIIITQNNTERFKIDTNGDFYFNENNVLSFRDISSSYQQKDLPTIHNQPLSISRISIFRNDISFTIANTTSELINFNETIVNQLNLGISGTNNEFISPSLDISGQMVEIYMNALVETDSNNSVLQFDISSVAGSSFLEEIGSRDIKDKNKSYYVTFGPHIFIPDEWSNTTQFVFKLVALTGDIDVLVQKIVFKSYFV